MTNVGDGDASRLRIGGWVPETGADDAADAVAGEALRPPVASGPADVDAWDAPPSEMIDGPTVEPGDSWDTALEGDERVYKGRRRLNDPTLRLWLAIAFVLVGLGTAVAIPVALNLSSDDDDRPDTASPSVAQVVPPVSEASASATPSVSPMPSPSPSQSTTVAVPPFRAVSYEAEARENTREGSARVRNTSGASGKKVVNRIGDWTNSEETEANNGTLTFTGVTVPAADSYTLTVYYAFLDDPDTRSMIITVNQSPSRTVTVSRPEGCCESSIRLTVGLGRGVNTIGFSNADGPAPAVDRIVISPA
jgi:hypothetical protein